MTPYELRLLDDAIHDLERIDRTIGRRIVRRLEWLRTNFESITREPLTGNLAGFCKLRVGDYRAIYEVLREERVLVIHMIGHRSEIYRKR